jgi:hypothetical protein
MRNRRTFAAALCIILAVVCSHSFAGDNPKTIRAVRVPVQPVIDGLLDDSCWTLADPAAGFIQRDPDEGHDASERSEIRVVYDDEGLTFGCRFYDSDPSGIVAPLTRRDREIETDWGSILIDSYNDNQTCVQFTFNPAGVKADILQYDDGDKTDATWDPVWELETQRLPDGWSAEVRIPFRILRYRSGASSDTGETVWGINFLRGISRKKETDWWAFTPKSRSGFISHFGKLTGLRSLPAPRLLEILPFITGRQSSDPATSVSRSRQEFQGNGGLDLKYGLSSNFILDATINPDFGQVEADPAVLNLSTYETFYPENRPFFIEGTQIIHFTTFGGDFGPGMFYSRRIGRGLTPGEVNVPAGGTIEDMPQQTAILGAVKLTGKTGGGLSMGVMEAFTKEERATVADSLGNTSEQVLEPFSHYNVLRLKQDLWGNSNVGMIVTSTAKNGRIPALTNGYDWTIRLDSNTYQLSGFLALSHTSNRAGAELSGSAGKMAFQRVSAVHWLWSLSADYTSPGYNINDAGFFFSPDDAGAVGVLKYKEDAPGQLFHSYSASLTYHQRHNFEGANLIRSITLSGTTLFNSYWSLSANAGTDYGLYDERETRGLGLYRRSPLSEVSVALSSDGRKPVVLTIQTALNWDTKRRMGRGVSCELGIRPLSWMDWDAAAEANFIDNQEAWVFNDSISPVFADRTTREYNFTLRGTVTFTRDLTLQIYQQIFLAKGHFEHLRVLEGTADFTDWGGLLSPDFNNQVLHTNVVLRWEYIPGSTMYLVWSQARSGGTGDYYSSFGNDLSESFRIPASNVLLLKVSYWMGI